jgi:hypothetical protein
MLIAALSWNMSCDRISEQLDIDRPKIVLTEPAHLGENIAPETTIRVVFSKEMDPMKTNEAFSLRAHGSGKVEGFFHWPDAHTLEFVPRNLLSDNCYTIRVESSAEDLMGNDLAETHESVFYVNADIIAPDIVSYTPADNATGVHPDGWRDPENHADSVIRIAFSEPMDIDSIYTGFTIMPSVQGLFRWNELHTEVIFTPIDDLLPQTTYTITLTNAVRDAHGNALRKTYSYRFTVGDDFTAPEIRSVRCEHPAFESIELQEDIETHGCEKDSTIAISFSEPVRRESVIDAVRLSPSHSWYVNAPALSDSILITFHESLQSETAYELIISPTIADAYNNRLSKEKRYYFITDGSHSTRPTPICITDTHHGFTAPFDNYECFAHDQIEPVTIYQQGTEEYVYIIFNKEIHPTSLHLSVTRMHGTSGSGLPKVSEIDWPSMPFGTFHVYRFFLSGIDADNIYRLTVRGGSTGIEDSYGNTMQEDYHQFFKVQAK